MRVPKIGFMVSSSGLGWDLSHSKSKSEHKEKKKKGGYFGHHDRLKWIKKGRKESRWTDDIEVSAYVDVWSGMYDTAVCCW